MATVAGKSVLITGAAHGIGAEVARRLAARGARVSLVGLGAEELERVGAQCPGSIAFEADVTDARALEAAVGGTGEAFGGIDTVIAGAGIATPGFVRTIDPVEFERTIEVNLIGVWRTVRACLPHVIERRGYILPIASLAAVLPAPGLGAYGAAKSGVEALGNALRIELRPFGVGVGVAYFSFIDTEMVRGAEATALGGRMRSRVKGPLTRTYPVGDAAEAVVNGVECRSRIVVCPRWLPVLIALRGVLPQLIELVVRSEVSELDRIAEEEARARGSDPVGAGGAAERAAR